MKYFAVVLFATLLLAPCAPAAAQTPAQQTTASQPKTHHVLFVLTSADEGDWQMTLANMGNFIKAMPEGSTEVELVAYAGGLGFLRASSTAQPAIAALEAKHVRFLACENSLRLQHLTAADLAAGVGTVPSGVVELVTRQEQGWSYIKAGR